MAHLGKQSSWANHHRSHHHNFPNANFSGSYPFLDRVFGTHKLVPIPVKRKDPNGWQR